MVVAENKVKRFSAVKHTTKTLHEFIISYFEKFVDSWYVHLIKIIFLKDIYMEKGHPNETPALTKSMNMEIWVVGTSNQLFIRGS